MKIPYLILLFFLASCSDSENTSLPQPEVKKQNAITTGITTSQETYFLRQINNTDAGIGFVHDAGFSEDYSIYEPLGSGLAILDYDNDGDMDLFIAQYGDKSDESKLYENDGFKFNDITNKTGLSGLRGLIFASVADFNNDGWEDLLVGGEDILQLWENIKGKTFKKTGLIQSPDGKQFFTGASWFDLESDGDLDLWVINYVDDRLGQKCTLNNGLPAYCAPKAYPALQNYLFINENQNHNSHAFTKTHTLVTNNQTYPALGIVADDFDNDGWTDVYIANDGVPNQLYMNRNGKFSSDEAMQRGAAVNLMGESEASMGVAIGDINNDSFPDLYITHLTGETNTFYMNNKGYFIDKTMASKLSRHVRPQTGFGTLFTDLNADNLLDIITVNGSIHNKEDNTDSEQRLAAENVQLWLQQHEFIFSFQPEVAQKISRGVGRGLVASDFDNDGDFDLVVNNNNGKPTLIKNEINPQSWIGFNIICNNRTALNTRVIYSNQKYNYYRNIHSDGSYASSTDSRIVFYQPSVSDKLLIKWDNKREQSYNISDFNNNTYNNLKCSNGVDPLH